MSDTCQRQRTKFPSLIGSPHVVGCCASLRGFGPTPVQLPPQRRVINDLTKLEGSLNSEQGMLQHPPLSNARTTIQSLPIELISTIFVLGSESDNPYVDSPFLLKTDQEYKPAPSSNFQVLVSQVCQAWRNIAKNTQSLWTTLHFRHLTHISRAEVYISRAGSFKLFSILIDTVAAKDHILGSTLYNEELNHIFQIIVPHINRWRAFHLKISDNDCKATARYYLGSCGSAPNLDTLQLYHFENYGTSQQLHLATYRPPVIIFDNGLPNLKNISLVGVNLGWDNSPYLLNLHNLELALHRDSIRPDYKSWAEILRSSSEMKTLSLYYSGPKVATSDPGQGWPSTEHRIQLRVLQELNLTDLDPEYLCDLMERLDLPHLRKLTLNLSDQDYTPFVTLLVGPPTQLIDTSNGIPSSSSSHLNTTQTPSPLPLAPLPIPFLANLESLTIRALSCTFASWVSLLRTLKGLRSLEVDFCEVEDGFWGVFTEQAEHLIHPASVQSTIKKQISPVLPLLEKFKFTGVSGSDVNAALAYRHKHCCRPGVSQEWTIGWSDMKRRNDFELDALINKGSWIPEDGSDTGKVVIKNCRYEEEEEEEEEDDDSEAEASDGDGDGKDGEELDKMDDITGSI